MPRGYEEGPVAEDAQARLDALERGEDIDPPRPVDVRGAVWGSTDHNPDPHFIGWADELDIDELFDSGEAWGLTIRK
jgi:hypothetical protein